jgi:mycothiol synthase
VSAVPAAGVARVEVLGAGLRRDVEALLSGAQAADGYPPLSDRALLSMREQGASDGGPVSLLAQEGGRVVGYGFLDGRDAAFTLELAVAADRRDERPSVVGRLVDAALDDLARRGGGTLRVWLRNPTGADADALTGRGMRPGRELLQLRARLPVDPAVAGPGVPTRPFRPGVDEEAWLEVNNRAFAGHPEQSAWTTADIERREREPWFDPDGFLLHEVDGRLAGFCWTKVHRHPPMGEIYVIGVDPDYQGRGLGRALTVAGLDHMAARGLTLAMLYVEASNTAARSLYGSLGFAAHHLDRVYTAEVPGAAGAVGRDGGATSPR